MGKAEDDLIRAMFGSQAAYEAALRERPPQKRLTEERKKQLHADFVALVASLTPREQFLVEAFLRDGMVDGIDRPKFNALLRKLRHPGIEHTAN